ncbi:hypothetical protein ARALYDRAFT_333130 [Arabidopsis lyrata subsp. lyrata]|uniref:F-box domain-containing protein n=1 Tax=Arabidopsis lyrata subsp. lyrata TaxID=81972 RepID=D7MVY2_ARALL|nr:hypothetical protein ARALYDRAFT_333130 [Arabidopsis lyrata subsp. lyrata]
MSKVHDWSKLCDDLLRSILEGLNTTKDFHRASSVCSNWYTISRTCKRPINLFPWQILFKENSTLLFVPEENKNHEIQHPGIDFSDRYVLTSCSNWLLMIDYNVDFFLINVFTRERINLPSIESSIIGLGQAHFVEPTDIISAKKQACLWIDETTKDYVVAWSYNQYHLFINKKGDDSWSSLEDTKCVYIACNKDYKLYVYTLDSCIKIFDISGDSPEEIVEENPYRNHPFCFRLLVAVTSFGEVLMIVSLKGLENKRLFYIYKMNLEKSNWERVDSLGGEMLIFGHGVTIRAPMKDISSLSDSIFFSGEDLWPGSYPYNPNTTLLRCVRSYDKYNHMISWFVPA